MATEPKRALLIQGWRFIHHSYAIVAQAHALALARRGDVALAFQDLAFPEDRWKTSRGILDPQEERRLENLRRPDAGFTPDATLRFARDFTAPPRGRAFVFDTPEFRILRPGVQRKLRTAPPDRVHMLVPSRWAAEAYLRFGIAPERVHVVAHGVDPLVLHPDSKRRGAMRERLGMTGRFMFLSIGAMTDNKGIDLLLRAFADVSGRCDEARLVLKGADDLYASRERLDRLLAGLSSVDRERVSSRLIYLGERLSVHEMADLLRAADCYVSPYLAEGFNLPVLEAAACGVPVVCTEGGATDDFTDASFAWRIRSRPDWIRTDLGLVGEVRQPDVEHLAELMLHAASAPQEAMRMGRAGAARVAEHFTWDRVTDRLMDSLFD
jgi:glycosyltransferase involved in cell wall biosynthesis